MSVPNGARYIPERGQGQHERIRNSLFPNLHNSLKMRYLRDWIFVLFIQIGSLIAYNFNNKSLKGQLTGISIYSCICHTIVNWQTYTNDTELNNDVILDTIFSEEPDTKDPGSFHRGKRWRTSIESQLSTGWLVNGGNESRSSSSPKSRGRGTNAGMDHRSSARRLRAVRLA